MSWAWICRMWVGDVQVFRRDRILVAALFIVTMSSVRLFGAEETERRNVSLQLQDSFFFFFFF